MSTPINVLIAEDSPDDADLVLRELRRAGFAPSWKRVETEADFLAQIKNAPDIILSDYSMPQFSGLRAAELLRESGRHIPFILISGTVGEDVAVEAMKHGATDYLLKDRIARLGTAVKRALEQERLRAEQQRAEQQIRIQSDALEAAANAILITDLHGKILSANTAACSLTGYKREDLLGGNTRLFKSGQHDADFYRNLWETILAGQVWQGEMTNRRKDGTFYVEEMTITPVRASGGKISHFVAVKRDITEARRAEEVVRKASQQVVGRQKARMMRELAIICTLSVVSFCVFYYSDALEGPFNSVLKRVEVFDDEILGTLLVLVLGLAVMAYRRWKEVRSEISQQQLVAEALRTMHDELETIVQGRTVDLIKVNEALRSEVGERRRAEQSLNLFRMLMDRSNDGIEVIDPETGRFLDINERTCQRLGYTREELLSMSVKDIEAEALDQVTWASHVKKIRQTGALSLEGRHRCKDGSTFPIEINVRYVKLEREYLIAAVRDITERRQAEEALRSSERRFREMLENLELIAMTLDQNGAVTFCNDYLLELTGWKREEVIGQDWCTQFIPESASEVRKVFFDNILKGNIPLHYENSIKTRNGAVREIRWNNTMLRDATGNITGTASIGEDVTERKQAEDALHESETKFRQLAENVAEVFWITNPANNEMLYISPAYEKIWGRTCESLYQSPRSWLDAIHPDDREWVLQAAAVKQARGDYSEIYRIVRPDGSIHWVHDRAFPLRDAAGRVYRMVGTATDITENRKLEEQLRQSQKMEAIGQLAGGVAHDFNNILAVIQMQAGMLRTESGLSSIQLEFTKEIEKATERAANLTRQLLLFSRRQTMQPRNVDLNDIVTNINKMLQRILGEDVRMQFKYAPHPLQVHADAGMMDQVLMNFTVNARDAMPGGGQLVIETSAVEFDESAVAQSPQVRPGSFACLSVSDTGQGIPRGNLQRIFEPFFTTKEVGKGTGLGLATVFGIVQQHQGWVNVYSEVGQGTTFRVYLPRLSRRADEVFAAEMLADVCGGSETILLVEDDPSLRTSMSQALARLGYRVLEAADGVIALELWQRHRNEIQLVLTDLVMPEGINGRELGIRLQREKPGVKVIYASGYSAEIIGKDFPLKQGVNFLTKPFEVRKLAQLVRQQLDAKD